MQKEIKWLADLLATRSKCGLRDVAVWCDMVSPNSTP